MMRKTTPAGFPEGRDPQVFYALAQERLETQLATLDALDNKLVSLIGFASALIGILAAVFALRASVANSRIGAIGLVLLIAASVTYAFVLIEGLKGYFSRAVTVGSSLNDAWRLVWSDDDDEVIRWKFANALWSHFGKNEPIQAAKSRALFKVLVAVILQSACVLAALLWVSVVA